VGPATDPRTEQSPDLRPARGADRRLDPAADSHAGRRVKPRPDRGPEPVPDQRPGVPGQPSGRDADRLLDPAADSQPDGVGSGQHPFPERAGGRSAGADDPQPPLRAVLRKDRPSSW